MPGLISGPTNACAYMSPNGIAAGYSVVAVSGVTYNWIIPAGATGLTGQGTSSIFFKYPAGYTTGSVNVTATNGCGTSPSRTQAIGTLYPATPGVIDVVQLQSCPNRIYSYTLPAMPSNAQSLVWTVPAGGVIINGQGGSSIKVGYLPNAITGLVGVTAISNCRNTSPRTTVVKLPACPPSFAGKAGEAPLHRQVINIATATAAEVFSTQIYPNPSGSIFNLKVTTKEKETIKVNLVDVQGRLIRQFNIAPNQMIGMGAELKAGLYMVEVKQGKNTRVTRLVKY